MFGVEKFDCVIGNPPYIRQEAIKDQKSNLQKNYQVHESKADIYVYFMSVDIRFCAMGGSSPTSRATNTLAQAMASISAPSSLQTHRF